MKRARRNKAAPIFVTIRSPDGKEKTIRCESEHQCATVVRLEAQGAEPLTLFLLIGENEDGRVVPLDRWAVSESGRLVHHPYRWRGRPASEAETRR